MEFEGDIKLLFIILNNGKQENITDYRINDLNNIFRYLSRTYIISANSMPSKWRPLPGSKIFPTQLLRFHHKPVRYFSISFDN